MCVSERECIVMCVLTGVFEQVCVSTCGCESACLCACTRVEQVLGCGYADCVCTQVCKGK